MFLNKKQQVKEGYVGRGNCKGTWETLTQNPSTFEEPMLRELSQEKHLAGDTRSLAKNSASSINCFRDETPSSLITCVHNSITTLLAEKNCVTYTFSVQRKTDFTENMPLSLLLSSLPQPNCTGLRMFA